MATWGVVVGRRLKVRWRRLYGSGEPGRRRVLRLSAWLCLVAAGILFGLAAIVQLNQPPVKRPLPLGTRFSVSQPTSAPAPIVAGVAFGPGLDETAAPEL